MTKEQNDDNIKIYLYNMQATEQSTKELVQSTWAKRPLIISGPCSAETEEQVLETAKRLAATGRVDMLRAGIWKPGPNPECLKGSA
jgi:chorismate mutase